MVQTLASYISLPGTVAEAMRHWQEVLGGEVNILRYSELPPMEGMPFTPPEGAVAHATLVLPNGAGVIAGGDSLAQESEYPVRDTAYSLLLTTATPDEARSIIAAFVAGGGSQNMPFAIAPWGTWYGQVFDRFGVMWALSCDAAG